MGESGELAIQDMDGYLQQNFYPLDDLNTLNEDPNLTGLPSDLPIITSQEEWDNLPPDTEYRTIDPNTQEYIIGKEGIAMGDPLRDQFGGTVSSNSAGEQFGELLLQKILTTLIKFYPPAQRLFSLRLQVELQIGFKATLHAPKNFQK